MVIEPGDQLGLGHPAGAEGVTDHDGAHDVELPRG
jgi:hypothetical protein